MRTIPSSSLRPLIGLVILATGATAIVAPAQQHTLTLSPTLTISGHDLGFGRIGAVVAGPDGAIYVADIHEQAQYIVMLDAQGRRIGLRGALERGRESS